MNLRSALSPFVCLLMLLAVVPPAAAENICGFVRVEVPANESVLVSLPFVPSEEGVEAVVGAGAVEAARAPGWVRILKWDSAAQEYVSATRLSSGTPELDGKWFADPATLTPSEMTLLPGEGFWIQDGSGTNRAVILSGEVDFSASNIVVLANGLNLVGYPYSTSIDVDDTSLGQIPLEPGDSSNALIPGGAESDEERTNRFVLSRGYWLWHRQEEPVLWVEARPYEQAPFLHDGQQPAITSLQVVDGGRAVELLVACSGAPGERIDIFYKDLDLGSDFDPHSGWQVAELDIPTDGSSLVEWRDAGSASRAAVDEVAGRVYVTGRADVDLDGEDTADARQRLIHGREVSGTPGEGSSSSVNMTAGPGDQAVSTGAASPSGGTRPQLTETIALGKVIYVDRNNGSDSLNGRHPVVRGGVGPKRTVGAALLEQSGTGELIVIKTGNYGENMDIAGKDVSVHIRGRVNFAGKRSADVLSNRSSTAAISSDTE